MSDTTQTADILAEFRPFFLQQEGRLELKDPTGKPFLFKDKQVVAVLHGPSTDAYKQAKALVDNAVIKRISEQKEGTSQDSAAAKSAAQTNDEIEAAFLTAITKRFENFPYPGGPAAVYLNQDLSVYIGPQVASHARNLGNFFTPPKAA